jgi:hypothetical protein
MRFFAKNDSQLQEENTDSDLEKGTYVFFKAVGGAGLLCFFEKFTMRTLTMYARFSFQVL